MIATTATNEHPATSLARFFASHTEAYRRMANAPCEVTGSDRRTMIDIETRELHARHLKGKTVSECAKEAAVTQAAMSGRFHRRGLEVRYHKKGAK